MENKEFLEEDKKEEGSTGLTNKINNKKPQKKWVILVAVFILILIISLAFFYIKKSESPLSGTGSVVIATVNGDKIFKNDYDAVFKRLNPQIEQSGQSNNKEYLDKVKIQIINGLINDKLLLQNAKKSEITVSEDEVIQELQSITERVGGEENLKNEMLKEGLTKEKLKEDIKNQIFVQKYLLANIDFNSPSVSEEEIKAFYDRASEGQEGVPNLEVVSSQIKDQITKDKRQKLINDFLDKLRATADINISF